MAEIEIRPALPADEDVLWELLFYASHANDEPGARPADVRTNPGLRRYVAGWGGRPGDLGVVALAAGRPAGGAWLRLFEPHERGDVAYVDDATPELAVAVLPGREGQGIGTLLLTALLESAVGRHPAVVLTVRAGNPALRLYERFGFAAVGRLTNRVGGESVKMVLALPAG